MMKLADEVRLFDPFQYVTWLVEPEPVRFEVFEMRQVPETEKQPFVRLRPFEKVDDAEPVTVIPFVDVRPPTARPFEIDEVPAPET